MPIDPGTVQYIPIASIEPGTLKLCLETFAQATGVLSGLMISAIFAVTWKG